MLNGKIYESHSDLRFNGTVACPCTSAINSTELSKIFIWMNYEGSKTVSKHGGFDPYRCMNILVFMMSVTLGFFQISELK